MFVVTAGRGSGISSNPFTATLALAAPVSYVFYRYSTNIQCANCSLQMPLPFLPIQPFMSAYTTFAVFAGQV